MSRKIYFTPQLILADGTILEGSSCGYTEHTLWCFLQGFNVNEAFAMMTDPEKTAVIRHRYGTKEEIYTGFTEVASLLKREFSVDVKLTGENTSREEHEIDETEETENGNPDE